MGWREVLPHLRSERLELLLLGFVELEGLGDPRTEELPVRTAAMMSARPVSAALGEGRGSEEHR